MRGEVIGYSKKTSHTVLPLSQGLAAPETACKSGKYSVDVALRRQLHQPLILGSRELMLWNKIIIVQVEYVRHDRVEHVLRVLLKLHDKI
jgi:hypothetical protein